MIGIIPGGEWLEHRAKALNYKVQYILTNPTYGIIGYETYGRQAELSYLIPRHHE